MTLSIEFGVYRELRKRGATREEIESYFLRMQQAREEESLRKEGAPILEALAARIEKVRKEGTEHLEAIESIDIVRAPLKALLDIQISTTALAEKQEDLKGRIEELREIHRERSAFFFSLQQKLEGLRGQLARTPVKSVITQEQITEIGAACCRRISCGEGRVGKFK